MELHCTDSSLLLFYIKHYFGLVKCLSPKHCSLTFGLHSALLVLPLQLSNMVFVSFKKSSNYHTPINCYLILFKHLLQHFVVICICTFCSMTSISETLDIHYIFFSIPSFLLLFCWSDRMSWTLTSQSILSNTKTNVLPSFNSCTARSKKYFPISSWTVYFIDLERQTPYLCNWSTSWKGIQRSKLQVRKENN